LICALSGPEAEVTDDPQFHMVVYFQGKLAKKRAVGHTAYDKAHAENMSGSFLCRIVECS
jgi:hypothetical protein